MEPYPEKRPLDLTPIDSFKFSTAAIEHSAGDIELQVEAWEMKISRLIEKYQVTFQGRPFPVIARILDLTHDAEELKGVAKALERVADHIQVLDRLQKQRDVIAFVKSDPSWLAWAFGDFNDDIDAGLETILEEKLTNED